MLGAFSRYLQSSCFSWRLEKNKFAAAGPSSPLFSRNYHILRKIGSGGYGTVFLVARRSDGKQFAAKIIPAARCRRTTWCTTRQMEMPDEVLIWEDLNHDNILRLEEAYLERGHWILVTEYLSEYIDLFDYNTGSRKMGLEEIRAILQQIISTCLYLRRQGIDHRDIKDENVLYNPTTGHVKLLDFGSASRITDDDTDSYTHIQGTDIYIPREFYETGIYTPRGGTVWSIGCLAYIMLNNRPPFVNREHVRTYSQLGWSPHVLEEQEECSEVRFFIEQCLEQDPLQRWGLVEMSEWAAR